MRRLKLSCLLILAACSAALAQFSGPEIATCGPESWVRCTELFVPRENPTCWTSGNPWRGSYLAYPNVGVTGSLPGLTPNAWVRLSITQLGIPADAKAVFIHSLGIVTHGTSAEVVSGSLAFRRPGSPYDNSLRYHTQVCSGNIGDGYRGGDGTWCPVENGAIEIFWKPQRVVSADWPTGSSIAFNVAINAWAR